MAQQTCDHTEQRQWLYGGQQENAFQCPPCGKIFTLAEIATPPNATLVERSCLWVGDLLARIARTKTPDCDAGDYLVPSVGY